MLCIAAMKTATAAIKGKKILHYAGIESEVVSLDGNFTKNGCAYGLSFLSTEKDRALRALQKARVNYGEILG